MRFNFDEVVDRNNTDSFKYDLREKIFRTAEVLPMWVADMDFRTPPFILEAIQRRLDQGILGYTYMAPSVFDAVVSWNNRRHGWHIKPGWISFAPGVVPALSLLVMAFTQPGDRIIVQPPVYFPFFSTVENHGRELVYNPLLFRNGHYEMDFEGLEAAIGRDPSKKPRMFFLCSPHNPTGNVWSADILRRVGQICLDNNILLVSDEIHADMVYRGHKHVPTASLSDRIAAGTITCMSPSKTFNLAGLSTAYVVIADEKLKQQYDRTLDHVHVGSGNIFGFTAMQAAYDEGMDWLDQLMEYLEGNLDLLTSYVHRYIPRIRVIRPEATYLVWLDCSQLGMDNAELQEFMIRKAGLGLNNGPMFGAGGAGFQRINIACPRSILMKALEQMRTAIEKYCGK